MKRKLFFIRLLCFGFTVVFAECFCSCTKQEKTLRFAIASDFHAPDVPDGEKRVASFIKAAKDAKVDFIIELGDFCRLDSSSQVYRELWDSFEEDKYHVIGNHDMDKYTPEEYVEGMKMPGRYYSFDQGDFHFIILDGNVTLTEEGADVKGTKANFVPPTPQDLNMGDSIGSYPLVSVIEDATIKF